MRKTARNLLRSTALLPIGIAAIVLLILAAAPQVAAEPTVIATIPVGTWPLWGVGVNPVTNRIYVANDTSDTISVIDGPTNAVVATVPVGDWPRGVAVNPTTNRIYVANQNNNNVSVIDGATDTEIDTDGNPANGITRIPVGSGPVGVGVNPTTNRIYVANFSWGSGSVSVIDGATNTEIDTDGNPANGLTRIPVGDRPHFMAVNPTTNRIYVANWGSHNVSVIDGATNTVVATVPVGPGPVCVDANPTTNRIYVPSADGVDVSVIDGATDTEIDTDGNPANGITRIPVGDRPHGVAVNPTTNRIYVAKVGDDNVSVIDGVSNTVVATVPVGDWPMGVGANPGTNRIYVTNRNDNTVSVIEDMGGPPPTPTPTPTPPPAVGGIVELRRDPSASSAQEPGSPALPYAPLAGAAAVAFAVLGGAWYVRRRRAR